MAPVRTEQWLRGLIEQAPRLRRWRAVGRVVEIAGLTVVAQGPPAALGELCRITLTSGSAALAQVVGFKGGLTLLLPLQRLEGVEPGCLVTASGEALTVPVGEACLGRVLDAFGRPLDRREAPAGTRRWPLEASAPAALQRQRISRPLWTGLRVIDGLLTCGEGQRVGIFSGAGVGKSSLLGALARRAEAEVVVVGLVGERGREVRDFVEGQLGEALARTVVIAATSDEPALVRIAAGLTATAMAEYFRDQGRHVLLLMDSLTRLARAQREAGLAAGEVPTTRGFPPSVYEFLARLLERAGPGEHGAITAFYSVLVEGDDMLEPIADAVSSILDGHLVLSRALADRGHHPAVEVTASVSRLMAQVAEAGHWEAARRLRSLLAAKEEVDDLLAIGAYRAGSNPLADRALRDWEAIGRFLRQGRDEVETPPQTLSRLMALTQGAWE